jgi:hypothetical protein
MLRDGIFWLHDEAIVSFALRHTHFRLCAAFWYATVFAALEHGEFFDLGGDRVQGHTNARISLPHTNRYGRRLGCIGRVALHIMGGIGGDRQRKWASFVCLHSLRFGVLSQLVQLGRTFRQVSGLRRQCFCTHIHFALGWAMSYTWQETFVSYLHWARQ